MDAWRPALVAAALACLLAGPVRGQASFDAEIQRAFMEGARLLQAGELGAAAQAFRSLLQRTSSPRVKLELARTLYLLGDYRESRALFREVQLEPDVPWQVRDNIEAFVYRIDNIVGYVKFSASVVSDSNPRNITSERDFTIGGVRLTFQPPEDNKRVTGLRYGAQAYQPLLRESGLSAYFSGSYLDYPARELDRLTLDAGVVKDLADETGPRVRAGVEAGTFGDRRLYEFPYLGYFQPLSRSPRHNLGAEFKLGQVNFPHFGYLDAGYVSGTLSAVRVLSPTVAVSMTATAEDSRAREAPYSYYGATLSPGIAWLITEPGLLLKAELALGQRRYGAADPPLFGETRLDDRARIDFSVRSKQWRWRNFAPVLVLSLEKTRSNLAFYSYQKANVSLAME